MADYGGKGSSKSLLLDMYRGPSIRSLRGRTTDTLSWRKRHRHSSLRWNMVLRWACTDPVPPSSAARPPYRPCPITVPAGFFITGLMKPLFAPVVSAPKTTRILQERAL